MFCPRCRRQLMERFRFEDVLLDRCLGCGGQWFDPGGIKIVPEVPVPSPPGQPGPHTSGGIFTPLSSKACPRCMRHLLRAHLGPERSISIEACDKCQGIWLDEEQLDRLRGYRGVGATAKEMNRATTWGEWWFQFLLGLPLEFGVKPRGLPWLTLALLTINASLFVPFWMGKWTLFEHGRILGLVPNDFFDGLNALGLFTYMFIHVDFWHLLGNTYFLYILGRSVEDVLGRTRLFILYVTSGMVGGIAHALFTGNPAVPMFGASAAVSGIMAGYMVLFHGARLTFMFLFFQRKLSALAFAWLWIVLQGAYAYAGVDGVAWMAHIGGFMAGLILVRPLRDSIFAAHPILTLLNSANFRDIHPG